MAPGSRPDRHRAPGCGCRRCSRAQECYDANIRARFGHFAVFAASAALAGYASGAPDPKVPPIGRGEAASAAATFTPASIPPVVELSDWEIAALEPPGRIAVPGTVQGLLWGSGLGEKRGPADAGPRPATVPRDGDYVFSFDGQLAEPVAFIAPDGQ